MKHSSILAAGAFLALFAPLLVSKGPEAQVFIVRVAINSIAVLLALGSGLWFFGQDGKMASYGAMVLASSAAQWAMSLRYISLPFTRKFDMKRLSMAWVLALVLSASAHAASPTPESIERLMAMSQVDKLFDGIKPQMEGMMKTMTDQATKGAKVSPDEQKILDKYRADVIAVVTSEMSIERMKPMVVQIYVANFSQEEVDGIIAFYETPVGQSMIRKMPQVMQAVMQEMPKIMGPSMEKMRKLSQEMQAELQALRKKK